MGDEAAETPVAIAGAGPVGLALGLGLARQGVASILLEEDEALSEHSKAPGVMARTLEIFRAWDVLPPFLEEGTFLTRVNIWLAGDSAPAATIDFGPLGELTAAPGVLILPQNRTEAILARELARTGGSEVRFGHRVVGFRDDEHGVTVQVQRRGGPAYDLRAAFLVGCDGAHSTVREMLGWSLEGKTYPTRVLLADVRLPDARNDLPWPRAAPVAGGVLAAIRMQPHLWRIIATLGKESTDTGAVEPAEIAARVDRLFGAGPFERVWASVFRIHCRTSPYFRRGRLLLAGDAAHINSPAGGQGMNSGIQDAHNLAWKLARVLCGAPLEPLVSSYEAERRPVILSNVDRYTDLLTRTFLLPPPRARAWIARAAAAAVQQPAVMRRLAPRIGMLDTQYRSSPLIVGSHRLAGARAPDAPVDHRGTGGGGAPPLRPGGGGAPPLREDRRLIDVAARDAALLLFDDGTLPGWDAAAVAAMVRDVPDLRVWRVVARERDGGGEADLVDATGQVWRAWRPAAATAALVRPDGHVGWIGERPTPDALIAGVRHALGLR